LEPLVVSGLEKPGQELLDYQPSLTVANQGNAVESADSFAGLDPCLERDRCVLYCGYSLQRIQHKSRRVVPESLKAHRPLNLRIGFQELA
jgi:hypothetical protein